MVGRRIFAISIVTSLMVGACAGAASPTPAPATQTPAAATAAPATAAPTPAALDGGVLPGKPFAGQTIGVWTLATVTWSKFQAARSAEFEGLTGIKVVFNDIPEAGWTDKIRLAQIAQDSSYDVYEGDVAFKGEYQGRSAIEPIDPYVNDPARSPTNFNWADFPAGPKALCTLDGKTVCIPEWTSGVLLYYNKKILADAGFAEPPKSLDELFQIAKATKTDQIAGICITGDPGQNVTLDAYIYASYQLPYSAADKGLFMGPDWKPQFNDPATLAYGQFYQDLALKYGPNGIVGYGYTECQRDFHQGQVALWLDADLYTGPMLDATVSKVVDQTGFASIPCPPNNPDACMIAIGKGLFINPFSTKKDAAWEYIKYITSKDATVSMVKEGQFYGGAIRASALAEAAKDLPADLAEALAYQKAHLRGNAFPPIPELIATVVTVADSWSKLLAGGDVKAIFADTNDKFTKILTDGGWIK